MIQFNSPEHLISHYFDVSYDEALQLDNWDKRRLYNYVTVNWYALMLDNFKHLFLMPFTNDRANIITDYFDVVCDINARYGWSNDGSINVDGFEFQPIHIGDRIIIIDEDIQKVIEHYKSDLLNGIVVYNPKNSQFKNYRWTKEMILDSQTSKIVFNTERELIQHYMNIDDKYTSVRVLNILMNNCW